MFSVPGSCLMQFQYLNDGGLVSFSSRSQTVIGMFGGHQIAKSAEPPQDVFRILGMLPKVKLSQEKSQFVTFTEMTSESSSEQTRRHTV